MPECSLSAEELVARLSGLLTVALATVTSGGEPRVAPVGALFVGGEFVIPTVAESGRARNVAARPAASVTYYEGADLAVIAHGEASIALDSEFAALDAAHVAAGGMSVRGWSGEGVFLRLHARRLFTFARA